MENEVPRLIFLSILLVAIAAWLFVEYRKNLGQNLRMMMAWALIFLGALAGFGLWDDIRNNVAPRQTLLQDGDIIELPRRYDGHYAVELLVNGTPVFFLVDTGATDVVLTQTDAERVGFIIDDLLFSGRANTANGEVKTAPVRLNDVSLGRHEFSNISASVNGGEMETSLLGMSLLGEFQRIEIANNRLRLIP